MTGMEGRGHTGGDGRRDRGHRAGAAQGTAAFPGSIHPAIVTVPAIPRPARS